MSTIRLRGLFTLLSLFSCYWASSQQLIHYWNFNNNSTLSTLTTPTLSLVNGAGIIHEAGGISSIDVTGGTGQNFNTNNLNARNGDAAGSHLRFNDPIGGALVFSVPTTGYKEPVVRFATRRSGSGAGLQYWSYTTDGTSYTPFDTLKPIDGNPVLEELNFTGITAANNNPNFKLKAQFAQGSGGNVGNNRFDNFTLDALSIAGQDNTPPRATFTPSDKELNVAISATLSIQFNEAVRRADGSNIDNSNAADLISFRMEDSAGQVVPTVVTFSNNTLNITPNTPLSYGQKYYLALLDGKIADLSGNVISTLSTITFTTLPRQTIFAKGDLAFVAYRMNASNADDEIAFVTFVDVLPGTLIHITDAKYTTNTPAQCSGGITWTAPANECITAGTTISIKTDAPSTNKGSVSGSGFGLSSGGDQVLVYTGTTAQPQYITALSSNGWVAQNTTCNGSLSMIPSGLNDGINALNMQNAPGNISGNSTNAYYNGTQTGSVSQIKTAVFDPANWIVRKGDTLAQTWPDYHFPGPPSVVSAQVINNTSIRLIFNSDLDGTTAGNTANYKNISNLLSAAVTNNGAETDTVLLTYSTPFAPGNNYQLRIEGISNTGGELMVCPFLFSFTYDAEVSFASNFTVTDESADTLQFKLNLKFPSKGSVDLVVLGVPYSTADTSDFVLSSQTVQFDGQSAEYTLSIPIIDDNEAEQQAEYFILALRNPVSYTIKGDTLATIYIKDNDRKAPVPDKSIELLYVGSFDPSENNNSTCEVVAYDAASRKLITSSAITGVVDIIDFSDPTALKVVKSLDINTYGGVTSVAVRNGLIAIASPNAQEHLDGSALFFDIDGNFLNQVTVGALPDMITFTPDGTKVLTANEGQPNSDYSIDPEGSVSIIDLSGGINSLTQNQVHTLYFTSFNKDEAELVSAGVRKTKSTSTLSQDLEPEYIAISSDSKKAWVTLQENNAIAELDLQNNQINSIWPLGTKDFGATGNGFDASDNNNEVLIANWPVKAYYIPDALAAYSVNGTNYIVTANEGDEKEYEGFTERTTVGDKGYLLDTDLFPNASVLKQNFNLGRMRVTNLNGDTNQDGHFEEIYCLGARSFSIWNADSRQLSYDSGDDFELYTSSEPSISALFNADHENNTLKSRSRAKGPEPEGVTIASLSGKTYAFITLERIGGVMVYDITDPQEAKFVDYKNSRSVSAYQGDHGPEGIIFVSSAHTATGKDYIVVANEISGTLSVFEVMNNNEEDEEPSNIGNQPDKVITFNAFPNPSQGNILYFNRKADIEVFNASGRLMYKGNDQLTLSIENYPSGIYLIRTQDGAATRFVIRK